MDIHARLRFARIAPRKIRLVAKTLSGLSVDDADVRLRYLAPRSADLLRKLLKSAVANAKQNFELDPKNLVIRAVVVNSGVTLKRYMPRARGSSNRIEKRTSHVDLVLTERTPQGGPRAGKKSEVVTRRVEELSHEELRDHAGHAHASPEGEETSSAVKKSDQPKSARQLFTRRAGEK